MHLKITKKELLLIHISFPFSLHDITIGNGNGFHALDEDKESSSAPAAVELRSEDNARISKNNNNVIGKANSNNNEVTSHDNANEEILHNDQLLQTTNGPITRNNNNNNNNKSADDSQDVPSKIPDESRVPSKLANNPRRTKNAPMSNTQLIKSYFENGERKENTRDVSPKKAKNTTDASDAGKKTLQRQDSFDAPSVLKNKNSTPLLEASLTTSQTELHQACSTAEDDDNIDDKIIALPSVKKIVQAFNEKTQLSGVTTVIFREFDKSRSEKNYLINLFSLLILASESTEQIRKRSRRRSTTSRADDD